MTLGGCWKQIPSSSADFQPDWAWTGMFKEKHSWGRSGFPKCTQWLLQGHGHTQQSQVWVGGGAQAAPEMLIFV